MAMIETKVFKETHDVKRRLFELELDLDKLLNVVRIALGAGAEATPFHAVNAEGTFRYQSGIFGLRDQLVDDVWELDRSDHIEGVRNEGLKVKVTFSNVDVACNEDIDPKPRSKKGNGAERACTGNLFAHLPKFARKQDQEWTTYYLMVDEKGAAELTIPIISGDTFSQYVERIYLSDGEEFDLEPLLNDDADTIEYFDPQVARK